MACPCCTFYYCHHDPCSKYGRLEVKWAGMTTEPAIRTTNAAGYDVGRTDSSCTFPPGSVGGISHVGMYGAEYVLIIGQAANDGAYRFLPRCAPSLVTADDFLVAGIIGTTVSFAVSAPGLWFTHALTYWQYSITKNGQTVTKLFQQFGDFREPRFGNGPVPSTCDDFIDAGNALKDVEPEFRLIQTGPGTKCLTTALEGRGFPAISGPHQNAAECEAVCGGPLP